MAGQGVARPGGARQCLDDAREDHGAPGRLQIAPGGPGCRGGTRVVGDPVANEEDRPPDVPRVASAVPGANQRQDEPERLIAEHPVHIAEGILLPRGVHGEPGGREGPERELAGPDLLGLFHGRRAMRVAVDAGFTRARRRMARSGVCGTSRPREGTDHDQKRERQAAERVTEVRHAEDDAGRVRSLQGARPGSQDDDVPAEHRVAPPCGLVPDGDHRPIRSYGPWRLDFRGQSLDSTGIIPGSRIRRRPAAVPVPWTATHRRV